MRDVSKIGIVQTGNIGALAKIGIIRKLRFCLSITTGIEHDLMVIVAFPRRLKPIEVFNQRHLGIGTQNNVFANKLDLGYKPQ